MTVGANYKNVYTGTGSQSAFPYVFKIVTAADLLVYQISTSGVVTILPLGSGYTVDGVGNPTGGNVYLPANLPLGYIIVVLGAPAIVQQVLLQEGGQYSATTIMACLDALTRMEQATNDMASRSLRVPANESPSDLSMTLPPAGQRAGQWLMFDLAGKATVGAPTSAIVSAAMQPVVAAATIAAAKAALAIVAADVSGLGYFATGTSAANLTGVLNAAQEPAFTGDVTKASGSVATTVASLNGKALPTNAAGSLTNDGAGNWSYGAGGAPLAADREVSASKAVAASDSRVRNPFTINYCKNPDAEIDASGWATYADAAGTQPVDGTGGSPSTTITRATAGSLLRGSGVFVLTKGAANVRGEGVSYDFTIDAADQNKSLTLSLDVLIASGTYAAGDISFWIYDVTNAKLVPVSSANTLSASGLLALQFSTNTSTSYRLCIHVSSVSASAYTIRFDNVYLGPTFAWSGPAVTDWQDGGTTTITGTTTNPTKGTTTTDKVRWRRVGDSAEITYEYMQTAAGAAGSGTYLLALPAGLVADTAKVSVDSNVSSADIRGYTVGVGQVSTTTGVRFILSASLYDSAHIRLSGVGYVAGLVIDTWSSGIVGLNNTTLMVSCVVRVPIAGWSGSQAVQPGSRYLWAQRFAANAVRVTATPTAPGQYRAMTRTGGTATFADNAPTSAPSSADGFRLFAAATYNTSDTSGNTSRFIVYIGPGKIVDILAYKSAGRTGYVMSIGTPSSGYYYGFLWNYDPTLGTIIIEVPPNSVATSGLSAGVDEAYISLASLYFDVLVADDPVPIALAPAVAVEANSTSGQVITVGTTKLQFENEVVDTHGAWNTDTFTCPVAGIYLIRAGAQNNASAVATEMAITVNNGLGSTTFFGTYKVAVASITTEVVAVARMFVGSTAYVQEAYASYTRSTDPNANRISITRISD